tara:strand:- start:150 stop:410 length:261 start_codon:yes stop_codon:yes gene_type:complete
MRTRIKSRKVSSSPAWLKKYQPAHKATADELVQRYVDTDLMLVPKKHRAKRLKNYIFKTWSHNTKVYKALVDKYVITETFNPISVL